MKKILNVIGSLNIGGAEINAMNILRNIDLEKYQYEFLVFDQTPGDFEGEAIHLGAKIVRMQEPKLDYKQFLAKFDALLNAEKYDVIHVNTLWNSGLLLKIAKKNHVPIRICHSHSTESSANENFKYKIYKSFMRNFILSNATNYIGCGKDAGNYLYGQKTFQLKGEIIYNGINIEDFRFNPDVRKRVRDSLHIASEEVVIGHVGRLAPVKNHSFMIELLDQLVTDGKNVKMIFVGDGPDYEKIQQELVKRNLEKQCILLGSRKDVNEILQAFDILLFPSLFEGFPVSLVEAQASGLPCVISGNITEEAVLTEHCTRISLEDQESWKKQLLEHISNPVKREAVDIGLIERSFDSKCTAEKWEAIYDGA